MDMEPVRVLSSLLRCALPLGLCVACTLPLSACQDIEGDPFAIAVASEGHGAILYSGRLSSVPHLLSAEGLETEGAAEADAWWESWTLGEGDGERLRSQIYPSAASHLYPVLGDMGIRDLLVHHGEILAAVETAAALISSEPVRGALDKAQGFYREAKAESDQDQHQEALVLALRSVDALWQVSPHQVGLDLMDRAKEGLRRIGEDGSYSEEELTRIRRLMYGAKEALDEGDYPRAIRRAYYACQLLGADPH